MEDTDSTFFIKKSAVTVAQVCRICCSTPTSILGFDQQTSCLAQAHRTKSHTVRPVPHGGLSVCPPRPIHPSKKVIVNGHWKVNTSC